MRILKVIKENKNKIKIAQRNSFFFFEIAGKMEGDFGKFPENTQKMGNFLRKMLRALARFSDVSSILHNNFYESLK